MDHWFLDNMTERGKRETKKKRERQREGCGGGSNNGANTKKLTLTKSIKLSGMHIVKRGTYSDLNSLYFIYNVSEYLYKLLMNLSCICWSKVSSKYCWQNLPDTSLCSAAAGAGSQTWGSTSPCWTDHQI